MIGRRTLDGLFDDGTPADLSRRSVRGGGIMALAQAGKFVVNLGTLAVLARLLSPEDFGLLAMAMVFVGFAVIMKDFGLSAATVQRRSISHAQVSAIFWLNLTLSAAMAGVFALLAPVIAVFYDNPALKGIVWALCIGIFAHGAFSQHLALLRRQMAFRALAISELAGLAVGGALAIAMALSGAGFWALVGLQVAQPIAAGIVAFVCCPWVPGRPEYSANTIGMIRFGGNLALFNVVNYVTRNADNALVGRYVGEAALGAYSRAYSLLMLPIRQLSAPIAAVAVPAMSRLQDDPTEFRRYFLKCVEIVALLTMPTAVVLGVLADEIVLLVMGPQWGQAADLFQIFAIFAFFQAVVISSSWTMLALGQGERILKWGVFQAVIAVPVFLAGLPWGAMGVAVAGTTMALVMMGPFLAYSVRFSPVSWWDVVLAVRIPTAFSLMLLLVLVGFDHAFDEMYYLLRLALLCALALLLFVATSLLTPRLRHDFLYFLGTLSRRSQQPGE